MIADILSFPDPRLRQPTVEVRVVTKEIRELVRVMSETMIAAGGVGLAAVQIGRPERVFVVAGWAAGLNSDVVFINPRPLILSDETDLMREGCLSCPGEGVQVRRSKSIVLQAMDLDGERFTVEADGFYARVIQHEYDHCTGVLIVDKRD